MANKPNNPSLWSKAKSLAKQKFDVYPSAYANGWAAKWYKSKGGTWRKAQYGMEVPVMEQGGKPEWLIRAQLEAQGYTGSALNQKMSSMANGGEPQNPGFQALPEYVQAKIISNMKSGGSTFSGNAWYNMGGYIPEYGMGGMPCYECGGMYAEGGESEMMTPDPGGPRFGRGYGKRGFMGIKPVKHWTGKNDSRLENIFEFFDPTGISSWDDLAGDIRENKGKKRNWLRTASNVLSVIPRFRALYPGITFADDLPKYVQIAAPARAAGDASKFWRHMEDMSNGAVNIMGGDYKYGGPLKKYQTGETVNDSIPYGHMNFSDYVPEQAVLPETIVPQSIIPARSSAANYTVGSVNDPSIVNYLAARDEDFSFAIRAELAKKYGVVSDKSEYRGTSEQNINLLKKLRESGDYADVVTSEAVNRVISAASSVPGQVPISAVDSASQVLRNPDNSGVVLPTPESRTSSILPYMIGAGAAGTLGYQAYRAGLPQMVGRGVDAVLSNPNVYRLYDKPRYTTYLNNLSLADYYREGVPPISTAAPSLPTVKPQSSLPRFMPEISYPPVQKIRTRTMTPEMKKANTKAIKEFLKKEAAKGAAQNSASYWDDFIRIASKTGQKMLRRRFQDGSEVSEADNLSNKIYNYLDNTNVLDHLWDYAQLGSSPEQKMIWQAQYGKRNPINNNPIVNTVGNIGQYFIPYYGTGLLGSQLVSALGSNNLSNEDKAIEAAAAAIPYGVAKVAKKGYKVIKGMSKKRQMGGEGYLPEYQVAGPFPPVGEIDPREWMIQSRVNAIGSEDNGDYSGNYESYQRHSTINPDGSPVDMYMYSRNRDRNGRQKFFNFYSGPAGSEIEKSRFFGNGVRFRNARPGEIDRYRGMIDGSLPSRQNGGPAMGEEMEVTPEQLEELRRQGYQFEMM